jgi:hypothetical protein
MTPLRTPRTPSARRGARSISRPKPHLASFAVRAFIRIPVLLLASCDEYGRICNSERDRRVITPKNCPDPRGQGRLSLGGCRPESGRVPRPAPRRGIGPGGSRRSLRRSSSLASCARYQSDLRAPKFCAAANPLVVRRTIVSKALRTAAASISGSDAWCRFLMISACRGDGTSP